MSTPEELEFEAAYEIAIDAHEEELKTMSIPDERWVEEFDYPDFNPDMPVYVEEDED